MTLVSSSRRGFLGGLAATLGGLIAAPAIVRAGSLMPISQRALIAPVAFRETFIQDSMLYEYWVSMGGTIVKRTAQDILSAPPGVYQPWLPEATGERIAFRPVNVERAGLVCKPEHLRGLHGWDLAPDSQKFVASERLRLAQERARLERELRHIQSLSKLRSHA